jgi:hypothetical protein
MIEEKKGTPFIPRAEARGFPATDGKNENDCLVGGGMNKCAEETSVPLG